MNRSGGPLIRRIMYVLPQIPLRANERRWDSSADGEQQLPERIPASEPGWEADGYEYSRSLGGGIDGTGNRRALGFAETGVPAISFSASRAVRYYGALELEGGIGVLRAFWILRFLRQYTYSATVGFRFNGFLERQFAMDDNYWNSQRQIFQ